MTSTPYENIYPKHNQGCSLFSKCCFFIPLKTGCFILGYITLVLNFFISLMYVGTLASLWIYTQGFRYAHYKLNANNTRVPDEDPFHRTMLRFTITLIGVIGCLYIAWFVMNVILIVKLHKKRLGHIKVHVTVASIRIALSVLGVLIYKALESVCILEIVLSTYFIILYYNYAIQLEREQRPSETKTVSEIVADVIYKYPEHVDKITLTDKKEKMIDV